MTIHFYVVRPIAFAMSKPNSTEFELSTLAVVRLEPDIGWLETSGLRKLDQDGR